MREADSGHTGKRRDRIEDLVAQDDVGLPCFSVDNQTVGMDAGAGATRMTLRNRGEPAGFAKTTAPLMEAAMRRANRNDLARLKEILEAGAER